MQVDQLRLGAEKALEYQPLLSLLNCVPHYPYLPSSFSYSFSLSSSTFTFSDLFSSLPFRFFRLSQEAPLRLFAL